MRSESQAQSPHLSTSGHCALQVSTYSRAALEGRAAAVRDFMIRQGALGNTTQPKLRRLFPQFMQQQLQASRTPAAAAASISNPDTVTATQGPAVQQQPNVQVVQLPDAPPTSGINVRTRTPVEVGSPVTVRTPTEEYVLGGRRH